MFFLNVLARALQLGDAMQSTGPWNKWIEADGLETHGEYLFNSALGRLRNREQAEDAVQETFLAALANRETFAGQSSKKTWLTGILNHKICDQLRNASRYRALFQNLSLEDHSDTAAHSGVGFTLPPRDPRTELESKELREALNAAIEKLSPREARVYRLYESGFWSGREICRALQISERNLWIMLHRARKKLRKSLSQWRSMDVQRNGSVLSAI